MIPEGASVVCSIPSEDKSKPSYYPAYHLSLIKYYTKPLSTFHQINCYEENSFLIMDMCCSYDGQANNNYLIQNLKKSANALDEVKPYFYRYNTMYRVFPHHFVRPLNVDSHTPCWQNLNTHLNTTATAIKTDKNKVFCMHEDLHGDDLHEYGGLEFPHINYSMCNSRPHRYFSLWMWLQTTGWRLPH